MAWFSWASTIWAWISPSVSQRPNTFPGLNLWAHTLIPLFWRIFSLSLLLLHQKEEWTVCTIMCKIMCHVKNNKGPNFCYSYVHFNLSHMTPGWLGSHTRCFWMCLHCFYMNICLRGTGGVCVKLLCVVGVAHIFRGLWPSPSVGDEGWAESEPDFNVHAYFRSFTML